MGVHGLWELLAPVGRRVSVETLAGKRLAVDASIWMVQFMRAMRDDKGDMLRDAHLLGFLRRICKLLFLRARPVFVFDGATPPLKRRTLAARRRHRDAAQAKIRKTAEKLLLSHLKARKLEELAAEITSDRAKHDAECKQAGSSRGEGTGERNENGTGESSEKAVPSVNQEKLDELLAASLAAEEETDLTDKGKSHSASVPLEERADIDDDDDDEEMIFPVTTANIDPAVLASLPLSMQLDLLVQMRETVMAENRQKYQKIKKEPAKFSELQIQSYLKTVAFRREIDEVQRCATGKGVGGVQTSKIASEANREFIFSSSFTGDKQMLTQRGGKEQDKDCVTAKKQISSSVFKFNAPNSSKSTQPHDTEPLSDFGPDVETYRDERGRIRVSRVRAMGIRMTRDIQRNLDFIKEHEHVKSRGLTNVGQLSTSNEEPLNFPEHLFESTERWSSLGCNEDYTETINDNHQLLVGASGNIGESSFQGSKETIEVSFLDDETEIKDNDDQMFLHLASGTLSNTDHLAERKEESDECIWEEGVVEGEILPTEADKKACQSFLPDNSYIEDEVEWEEGVCDVPSSREYNHGKVPKGDLEEETLIQEAIRRSLEDFENQKSDNVKLENLRASNEGRFLGSDADIPKPSGAPGKTYSQSKAAPVKEVVEETGIQVNSDRYDVMHDPGVVTADRQLDQTGAQLMNNDGYTDPNRACSREPVPPSDISVSALAAKLSTRDSSKVQESDEMAYTDTIPEGPKKDDKIIKQDSMNSDICIGSDKSKCLGTDTYLGGSSRISQKDHMMDELVADTAIQKEKVSQGDVSFSTSERGCGNDDDIRVSAASLEKEISLLRQEQVDLGHERRKLESHAESVSSEMFAECQELLQMFGLPYIIAPTEAEAQCAYMEMKNLVDGVVTDDSDVFLFGARNVYKNIFDDRKYVETYFMKDVETELGLTREQLIRMALLLGSDYTEGISGIGIVNAIEVVHAFPEEDGLQKFREWIESPDPAILGKLDLETGTNLKKSKPNRNDSDGKEKNQDLDTVEGSDDKESSSDTQHIKEIFMSKHRNVSKNWHIPSTFPSDLVVSAYTSPQVDDSTEPFSWGRPDLSLLRKLCWERFGWSKEKADELLLPVLKEYNKHETQLRLEAFYSFNERFARIRSKRIKKAIKGITGKSFPDADEIEQDNPSNSDTSKKETSSCHARGRGRRNTNTALRNMGHQDPTIHEANSFAGKDKVVQENNSTNKKKCVSSSGRSRGRGRRRTNVGLETMEGQEGSKIENVTLASDEDSNEKEAAEDISSAGMALRRSKRPRKQVIYVEDGHDADDDIDVLMDQIDENDLSQAAVERALAGKDAQSDLVHQEMNKLKSDQVHTDLQTARVLSGKNNEDRHASGFELCEDSRIDSAAKDYLFTGGGFCMEENDEQQDTTGNTSACQPRETMEHGASSAREETSGASDGDQHMDLLNAEESAVNAAVEAIEQRNSPSENVSSSRRRNASRGLSAMPTLKRRKGGS